MKNILFCTLLLFTSYDIYSQCPCDKTSLEQAIKTFEDILVVEVIAKKVNNTLFNKNQLFPKGIINELLVVNHLKGNLKIRDTISCLSRNSFDENGFNFKLGEWYIFFKEDFIDSCSPTINFDKTTFYSLHKTIHQDKFPPKPFIKQKHISKLYREEINPMYYENIPMAEISYLRGKLILSDLITKVKVENELELNDSIWIKLTEHNKISHGLIIRNGKIINSLNPESMMFIENNLEFKTIGYECLLNESTWSFKIK